MFGRISWVSAQFSSQAGAGAGRKKLLIRMGDVQVTAAEANLNFDMLAFHNNFVRSVSDHNTQARPPPLIPS